MVGRLNVSQEKSSSEMERAMSLAVLFVFSTVTDLTQLEEELSISAARNWNVLRGSDFLLLALPRSGWYNASSL